MVLWLVGNQKFYGPFVVVEKVDVVAYKLKLPVTTCIHNVFHVSILKELRDERYL